MQSDFAYKLTGPYRKYHFPGDSSHFHDEWIVSMPTRGGADILQIYSKEGLVSHYFVRGQPFGNGYCDSFIEALRLVLTDLEARPETEPLSILRLSDYGKQQRKEALAAGRNWSLEIGHIGHKILVVWQQQKGGHTMRVQECGAVAAQKDSDNQL